MDRIDARAAAERAGPSVFRLRPPYREPTPWLGTGGSMAAEPPRGSIVVVRVRPETPWSELAALVERLQRELATCPVIFWTDGLPMERVPAFACRGRMIGVRACMLGPALDVALLREVLTDVLAFPADLTHWLVNRGFEMTPRAREQLENLATRALDVHVFHEFLSATGQDDGALRSEFEKSGLGAPGRWFHLLRTLRMAIAIQAQPVLRVAMLARQYGFYDPAHLRRRLDDVIGANPTAIHHFLSWEWMLFVALRRARIVLPADPVKAVAAGQ
jgi:hypothetical protein